MARLPESEIERLKQEISLELLVASQGIELKRYRESLVQVDSWMRTEMWARTAQREPWDKLLIGNIGMPYG